MNVLLQKVLYTYKKLYWCKLKIKCTPEKNSFYSPLKLFPLVIVKELILLLLLLLIVIVVYREISMGIHFFSTHKFWTTCHITTIKAYSWRVDILLFRICFYRCSIASGSKLVCRKKVDTPWSIYRDLTVIVLFI